jgi:hypothetical protein
VARIQVGEQAAQGPTQGERPRAGQPAHERLHEGGRAGFDRVAPLAPHAPASHGEETRAESAFVVDHAAHAPDEHGRRALRERQPDGVLGRGHDGVGAALLRLAQADSISSGRKWW